MGADYQRLLYYLQRLLPFPRDGEQYAIQRCRLFLNSLQSQINDHLSEMNRACVDLTQLLTERELEGAVEWGWSQPESEGSPSLEKPPVLDLSAEDITRPVSACGMDCPAASEDIPTLRVRVPDTVELGRRSRSRALLSMRKRRSRARPGLLWRSRPMAHNHQGHGSGTVEPDGPGARPWHLQSCSGHPGDQPA